jgi:PAS domain S-box-containing protein
LLKQTLKTMESALKELTDINYALDKVLIVAITDPQGTITFANQKFCEISKYSLEELLGQNHRIINSGYHSKEFFREMWRTIGSGKIWRGEIQNKAKDGTLYWVDTTIVPCLNEQGKPYRYVSFRIDITNRKKAEEQLRRSERIAAAGQLASGIAHEIRNPLAAIKWSLQFLRSCERKEQENHIDLILSELERIDSIVGDFLKLAKPDSVSFHDRDVRVLLEQIVRLMNTQAMRNHVQFVLDCENEIPLIHCEENQLKQVFINLIKNALEAMPNGGTLTIQVQRDGADKIRIRFVDQGHGIPAEYLPRLGEPFFTTKEKGTGLGLMISHKIIEDHGGKMWITSEVNRGTTVEILLPIAG